MELSIKTLVFSAKLIFTIITTVFHSQRSRYRIGQSCYEHLLIIMEIWVSEFSDSDPGKRFQRCSSHYIKSYCAFSSSIYYIKRKNCTGSNKNHYNCAAVVSGITICAPISWKHNDVLQLFRIQPLFRQHIRCIYLLSSTNRILAYPQFSCGTLGKCRDRG